MRAVPSSILTAARRQVARPVAFLDIWPEKGPFAIADSQGDWKKATASSNVDVDRVPGSVVLAAGSAHALAAASAWTTVRDATWTATGAAGQMVTAYGPVVAYPFIAGVTQIVDEVRIRLQPGVSYATSVIDPISPYGAVVHIWADVWIADAAGNQIGSRRRVHLLSNGAGVTPYPTLIQALGAALTRSQSYRLCVQGISYGGVYAGIANAHVFIDAADLGDEPNSAWRVPITGYPNHAFPLGGQEAFQPSGSIAVVLDVGQAPTQDGALYIEDLVPLGCSLTYSARYSDDGVSWTSHGAVQSGDALPPHRYWEITANLASNPGHDYTPEVQAIRIEYAAPYKTLASAATAPGVERALDSVSALAHQLSPKAEGLIRGEMTVQLAPQEGWLALRSQYTLGGRRARVRAGYVGVGETLELFAGIVREEQYARNRYTLTLRDATDIADREVPEKPYPAWSSTATYNTGDRVSYAHKGYVSLADGNVGHAPDASPSWWQELGGVWQPADYSAGVHLADIALDILRNYTSLRDDQIDMAALSSLKTDGVRDGRTSQRIITKPQKALKLLAELALLLEAHWVMRGDQVSIIPEPEPSAAPIEEIGPEDVAEGLQYRRGWKDVANTIFLLAGYNEQVGSGSAAFSDGYVIADAGSIEQFGPIIRRIEDRWGLPAAEREALASRLLNRWKNGRAVVQGRVSMRLLGLEPGDVVSLSSRQLPPDTGALTMMVTRADLDWQRQSLNLTLLEVT